MLEFVRPPLSLGEILGYSFLSFIIALICTKPFLRFLHHYRLGKQLRVEAVDGGTASTFLTYHQNKAGVPTMGGILIWGSIALTVLLSRFLSLSGSIEHSLLQRGQVYVPMAILLSMGILGAIDDYWNIKGLGKNKGLGAIFKLLILLIISGAAAWWFYFRLGYSSIHIPFAELLNLPEQLELGLLYIPLFMFVVIGTANAVNVTDGLDGLAGGLLVLTFSAFGIIAYLQGLFVLSGFCGVVIGAIAAFLWHNVPPAQFFMGDTGALALGGTLAVIACMIDQILILPLVGFVFVIEMLSVIIQLCSKKIFHQKVLKAAPLHHHFEALNWGESKVTMRFWIIGAFSTFFGVLVAMYG